MYNSNEEFFGADPISVLEPLFIRYKVDFTLSGHIHAYERTKNMKNMAIGDGPFHIYVGTGGM